MAAINVAKRTARVSKDTPTEVLNKLTSSELDPMLDKTIGQCIEEGLITDMCNSKGEFAFKHANYDNVYALINGGLVDVSAALASEIGGYTSSQMERCLFKKYDSADKWLNGKPSDDPQAQYKQVYRLTRAGGINTGDAIASYDDIVTV